MSDFRKLILVPFFGELPPWMEHYWANVAQMFDSSYTWIVETDEDAFRKRAEPILGVNVPPMHGTGKTWDYRPALGLLYERELRDGAYDFWGHVDFDVVWGRVPLWITDDFLDGLDMHSNHPTYVNGCWSLYSNTDTMREAFLGVEDWQGYLEEPRANGWAEGPFSKRVEQLADAGVIGKEWTHWQVYEVGDLPRLRITDGRLMLGHREEFMAHFKRTKTYPAGCLA